MLRVSKHPLDIVRTGMMRDAVGNLQFTRTNISTVGLSAGTCKSSDVVNRTEASDEFNMVG